MQAQDQECVWETMIDEGYSAYLQGHLYEAEMFYTAALALAYESKVIIDMSVGKIFFLLGELYLEQEQYIKAEDYYRSALTLYEQLPETSMLECCITLKRMSESLRAQGKSHEAAELGRMSENLLRPLRKSLDRLYQRPNFTLRFW